MENWLLSLHSLNGKSSIVTNQLNLRQFFTFPRFQHSARYFSPPPPPPPPASTLTAMTVFYCFLSPVFALLVSRHRSSLFVPHSNYTQRGISQQNGSRNSTLAGIQFTPSIGRGIATSMLDGGIELLPFIIISP